MAAGNADTADCFKLLITSGLGGGRRSAPFLLRRPPILTPDCALPGLPPHPAGPGLSAIPFPFCLLKKNNP